MTKRRLLTITLAGGLLAGGLSLAGCATLRPGDGMETVSVDVADGTQTEGIALAALGITGQAGIADKAADKAASNADGNAGNAGDKGARHRIKVRLRKNMLHGEVVVQTKDGPKTIVVQRGAVTAKGNGTVTVKSTDGYTATWSTTDQTKVVEKGAKATVEQITVGEAVGIGGVKSDPQAAQLVVVPKKA